METERGMYSTVSAEKIILVESTELKNEVVEQREERTYSTSL